MRPRRRAVPLLLFVGVLTIFCLNLRTIGAGDTLPARYLPISLLRAHDIDLDEFPMLYDEAVRRSSPLLDGIPYFLRRPADRYLSAYAPGPAILALPVYAVPVLAGLSPASPWVAHLEKIAAALITAGSVVALFAAVRRLTTGSWALVVALVYALGTSSLSISSQALWQHGPSQLFLSLGLYCLVRLREDVRFLPAAGLAFGVAVVMRSTNLLLLAPLAVLLLYRHRLAALPAALLFTAPLAAQAAYDLAHYRTLGTGLGHLHVPVLALFSQTPWLEGVTGLLFSPGRGLFVYSPVLLWSVVGIALAWRRGPALFRALGLGLPLVVLVASKWFMWWGGHTYGPRVLADAAPVLCFLLYPVGSQLERRRLARIAFAAAATVSVGVHLLGAFAYDGRWDALVEVDRNPAALWSWRAGPLPFYARQLIDDVAWPIRRQAAASAPTSATAPAMLRAEYSTPQLPTHVVAGGRVTIPLEATNTGGARWLASTPAGVGTVRLGWRWRHGTVDVMAGNVSLTTDIAPGESTHLLARIPVPEPGHYLLVIDLFSDRIAWFADQGSHPVRHGVTVLPADLRHVLAQPGGAQHAPPSIGIDTGRRHYGPDEPLELTVRLSNSGRPRNFDGYLVLRGADGAQYLYDGQALTPWAGTPWPPWVKGLPLPARVTGRFVLSLRSLPPGRYEWHAILTEAGSLDVVSTASTSFSIGPASCNCARPRARAATLGGFTERPT